MTTKRTADFSKTLTTKPQPARAEAETQGNAASKKMKASHKMTDSFTREPIIPTQGEKKKAMIEAEKIAQIMIESSKDLIGQGHQPKKMSFPLSPEDREYFKKMGDNF